ncbi:MAG: APC family permease [Chloroflexi bacterium]|nr:APC family permease [Chloroflexota bacterium]
MTPESNGTSTSVIYRATKYKPRPTLTSWLIGRPLSTADAPHQTIGKAVGLAVFSSDALSSTAYATQEIMVILAAAGTAALSYVFPISLVIVVLLAIVAISYEQTIHAYPDGGGSYIVSRDNLGQLPGLVAAAALLTDYVLTVAVSISSGVAQLTSAFPVLFPYRVWIALGFVAFITIMNLRGVRESGAVFAIPTYFFISMMYLVVGSGLIQYFRGTLGVVSNPPPLSLEHTVEAITPFLLLHAFSSGTTALTGIEAISNGITAFREPRSRNAGITLMWMAGILSTLFLGISFLSMHISAVPSENETVISQLARTVFGGQGILYLATIAATMLILILAANTSFADFPRLSAFVAKDGYLPRQLTYRGSRLVYSNGILLLAFLASLLIIGFQASVTRLIPLYAIGVFLAFTLSQAGMARRWWKVGKLGPGEEKQERASTLRYDTLWPVKMVVNGFGAVCTFVVMLIFAFTKFADGAWLVILIFPLLIVLFLSIHRHYQDLAKKLSLEEFGEAAPIAVRHRVFLPLSGVHRGTLAALRYAQNLSEDITAIHVSIDPEETEKVQRKWERWGDGTRLVVLDSPYRLFLEPLLDYLQDVIAQRQPHELITIVVPQFVPSSRWHEFLHMRTADLLRDQLLSYPGVVIVDVPYQV